MCEHVSVLPELGVQMCLDVCVVCTVYVRLSETAGYDTQIQHTFF